MAFSLAPGASPAVNEILQAVPANLLSQARQVTLNAGEALFHAGEKVRSVFLALSGEVRLIRIDRRGT